MEELFGLWVVVIEKETQTCHVLKTIIVTPEGATTVIVQPQPNPKSSPNLSPNPNLIWLESIWKGVTPFHLGDKSVRGNDSIFRMELTLFSSSSI